MKATKGNKVYSIDESQKRFYISQGFDITEDNGTMISYGAGKSVSYEKYKELEGNHKELTERYVELEKENLELRLSAMTVEQLKLYAAEKNIDVSEATTKDTLLDKIRSVN